MVYQAKIAVQYSDDQFAPADEIIRKVDRQAAIAHTVAAIGASRVRTDPFPYLLIESVFDETTYAAISALMKLDDLFCKEVGAEEMYTIFRYRDTPYDLSPDIRDFIDFMATEFNPAVSVALIAKFGRHLRKWGQYLIDRGVYIKTIEALTNATVRPFKNDGPTVNDTTCWFELIRRTQQFAISPHCHPIMELMIGIYAIAPDDSLAAYGTEMHRLKKDCSLEIDEQEFCYVDADKVELAGRAEFRRNTCFMMLNCSGIHAYTPPAGGPRQRDYIYTTLRIPPKAFAPRASNARKVDMSKWASKNKTWWQRLFGL